MPQSDFEAYLEYKSFKDARKPKRKKVKRKTVKRKTVKRKTVKRKTTVKPGQGAEVGKAAAAFIGAAGGALGKGIGKGLRGSFKKYKDAKNPQLKLEKKQEELAKLRADTEAQKTRAEVEKETRKQIKFLEDSEKELKKEKAKTLAQELSKHGKAKRFTGYTGLRKIFKR